MEAQDLIWCFVLVKRHVFLLMSLVYLSLMFPISLKSSIMELILFVIPVVCVIKVLERSWMHEELATT